ncbi:MAG: hypothetical protein J6S44_01225, partial [Clostridia bacterium]|nr:hypothetical protein [Clostridia bacterium]
KAGVEPYYRLGVTIENAGAVKQLWVKPPEDMEKWASVCEHIVRHYNEGWADGFHYGITYWEIWGEPDNPPYLWTFEKEEYFRLYATTAKLLKEKHPSIKVGAYGCTGFYRIWKENPEMTPMEQYRVDFFHEFFDYVTKEKAPIDFFSWHS